MSITTVNNTLPPRLLMGAGALGGLKELLPQGKLLLVTDKGLLSTGIVEKVKVLAAEADVFSDLSAEPTTDDVDRALAVCRSGAYAGIVGVGGGSALDVAKALAALAGTGLSAREALGPQPDLKRDIFFAAVPTTAGTGSESTLNAILVDSDDGVKKAIVSAAGLPDVAVLDPALTLSLPPSITASTGVDALCHCVESLISVNANPVSETYSRRGIALVRRSLRAAVEQPDNIQARYDMLYASYLGGAALAIAGTCSVHALAYPLGKRGIPHGTANSMLFLETMRFNLDACAEKLASLREGEADGARVLEELAGLVRALPIPAGVEPFGVKAEELDTLAEEAMEQTRLLGNNPKPMTWEAARAIYATLF